MRNRSPLVESEPIAFRRANLTPDARVHREHQEFSAAAQALIGAYRLYGSTSASINPLDTRSRDLSAIAELDPRTYGLASDEAASYAVHFGGALQTFTLAQLLIRLRDSYCSTLALDSAHIRAGDQRAWLHAQMEERIDAPVRNEGDAIRILEQLAAAEAFEHFHRAEHPGKQFSLEGSESFVPLLNTLVERAAERGVQDVVLGMAHRGRLNVLRNVLDLPADQVLSLFSESPDAALAAWDLRDHVGHWTRKRTRHGTVSLLLAHNPSHLGSISPVVCGMARALQDRKTEGFDKRVMPVLVHGDAAFSAQGIVTETLNLSQTRGYSAGGTVHVVLNNQIGSTVSDPRDSRSTIYCADIARAIDAPIVHVNADDADAVVAAAEMAVDYRMRFGGDFVIDLVGYRRHGHFGGDDPTMTQPAMQRIIRGHRSVLHIYAERLAQQGIAREGEQERLKASAFAALADAQAGRTTSAPAATSPSRDASATPAPRPARTAVPIGQLRAILQRLIELPPGFQPHAGIQKMREGWQANAGDDHCPVDWRLAENLAYGSLLANGFNVRLTGLDVGRGSCFHRQHVWHHQATAADGQNIHVPLRHVANEQGYFSIFESPLSEEAVLGFEYGYAVQCGRDLVLWEAQLGDFVNNAQTIIDQFIAAGEHKWGYANGLVVLLPHGHEGAGPEHSSAFLGRFLQLCAGGNIRVAMPSTAAQNYHLLRRQALTDERKPLIVMTPKTCLYGQAASYSRLLDLAQGEFDPLLGESAGMNGAAATRVIVTSGKLYYDLVNGRTQAGLANVPVLRAEQLYPFPTEALAETLARLPQLKQLVWAQEEARNHGAWHFVRDQLQAALPPGVALSYAGRPASAPTAVCNARQHRAEQHDVVASALGIVPV
jgi:2-oxoglutarate dehydrogenase E1 component